MVPELYILTVRPAFLGAIRSWVGKKSLPNHKVTLSPEDSLSDNIRSTLRTCTERAKENVILAILLRGGQANADPKPLLLQELHHLFNAAVVLMMYQSVFTHLRSRESELIGFAVNVFSKEAKIGSVYANDCLVVLHDLRELVLKLRGEIYGAESQQQNPGPGEQILSSLILITSGYEASPPPFVATAEMAYSPQQNQDQHEPHTLSWMQRVPLRPYPNPETNRPSRPIKLEEWLRTMEIWALKGVTGWYIDGGCMVDERN
jgi:hypothetical protein